MSKFIYQEPEQISKIEALQIFATHCTNDICNALVALAFYNPDWKWVQDQCLIFINHKDIDIQKLAAICLGHLARIHSTLEKEKVLPVLMEKLNDKEMAGTVQDALDDIKMFWKK